MTAHLDDSAAAASAAGVPAPAPAEQAPADDKRRERLTHLFRHTLRSGLFNPLLHLVAREREEPV